MLRGIPTLAHPPRSGEELVKRDGEEQLVVERKTRNVCGSRPCEESVKRRKAQLTTSTPLTGLLLLIKTVPCTGSSGEPGSYQPASKQLLCGFNFTPPSIFQASASAPPAHLYMATLAFDG